MRTNLLVIILVLAVLAITFGCINPHPVCGNNICEQFPNGENELNQASAYYCPKDCGLSETHAECKNLQCIQVDGVGTDLCKTNTDCETNEFHSECNNLQCIQVSGAGTNNCSSDNDCSQTICNFDEKPLPEDYNYEIVNPANFYNGASYFLFKCSGTITERHGLKCCNGQINEGKFSLSTYTESRLDAPANFFASINSSPAVNVLIDGNGKDYNCKTQLNPKPDGLCVLSIEQTFQKPGVKNYKVTINDGDFAGKTFSLDTNVLSGDAYAQLCDSRRNQQTSQLMSSDSNGKEKQFNGSGIFSTIQLGNEKYIIDEKKARAYIQKNPNAKLSELQEITLNNTYIVELVQPPALKKTLESSNGTQMVAQSQAQISQIISSQANTVASATKSIISQLKLEKDVQRTYKYTFGGFAVKLEGADAVAKLTALATNPAVKSIYPNREVHSTLEQSVPFIKADKVWAKGLKGEGIKVGIIDTGIDYTHPDLGGCIGQTCKVKGGKDFVNNDDDPMDDMGHGTHVAAIVASDGSLKGVAPKAALYGAKVLDSSGSGSWENVMAGIEWAWDPNGDGNFSDKMDVINLSLGGEGNPDDPISTAIDLAAANGVIPVVAAGNEYSYRSIGSPGTARKAITVAAAYMDGNDFGIANFSSKGPYMDENIVLLKPDLTAPGVNICAAEYDNAWSDRKCFDDRHIAISGTSMATPHVAGVAALLRQEHPTWTVDQIKSALVNTATPNDNYDQYSQGAGVVDAEKAYDAKILFNPATASIGYLDQHNTATVEVENVSGRQLAVILPQNVHAKKTSLSTGTISDLAIPLIISSTKLCLMAGEKTTLTLTIDTAKTGYGLFSGYIPLQLASDCSGNPKTPTIGAEGLPFSFAKSKIVLASIHFDPHITSQGQFESEFFMAATTSDGNIVGSTGLRFREYTPQNAEYTASIEILEDVNVINLTYVNQYDTGDLSTIILLGGNQILPILGNSTNIVINESHAIQIKDNYKQYIKTNNLNTINSELMFSGRANGNNLLITKGFSDDRQCPSMMRDYYLFSLTDLNSESEFSVALVNSKKNEISYGDGNWVALSGSVAIPSPNPIIGDENPVFTQSTIKFNPVNGSNKVGYYLQPYRKDTQFLMGFYSYYPVINQKTILYTNSPEFGYWINSHNAILETDPLLRQVNFVPYAEWQTDSLYNGKKWEDFNWNKDGLPSGSLPAKLEFLKEPFTSKGLEFFNNYLTPVILSDYIGGRFVESSWNLYTAEQIAPYRKGITTITKPDGSKVIGQGVMFAINCANDETWAWPKLFPCAAGEYKIHVDTNDLFKINRYQWDYDANWVKSGDWGYWKYSAQAESIYGPPITPLSQTPTGVTPGTSGEVPGGGRNIAEP